jgi:MoaA/NifB/PqqE/SkfB family radical SAM enzyme
MTSNGMLLSKKTAEWLVSDQSLHELCISFDGAVKQTLERVRVGAKYEQILGNIEYLSALKKKQRMLYPRLWFRFVIMRSNAEELPDMIDLCRRYGLYRVDVVYLNVTNDIDFSESLFNHPQLASEVFAEARRRAKDRRIELRLPPLPGQDEPIKACYYPWEFCQIDTDGSVRICYRCWRQRLGFFQDGFSSIWRGEHYRKIRESLHTNSPYYPYCLYCGDRLGCNWEGTHNQRLHSDLYLIPGLEKWQVPFNERAEENVSSLGEMKKRKIGT